MVFILIILIIFGYWYSSSSSENDKKISSSMINKIFKCLKIKFEISANKVGKNSSNLKGEYHSLTKVIESCVRPYYKELTIEPHFNKDEIKFFVPPIAENRGCNVITLGIGRDIDAELSIQKKHPQCKFLGADIDDETSGKMYMEELGGKYVKTLVSAKSGKNNATVLTNGQVVYKVTELDHISFREFLNVHNKNQPIDLLLMDIEGDEFDLIRDIVLNTSKYPPICQMNIEFHDPEYKLPSSSKIFDTLLKMAEKRDFLIVHSQIVDFVYYHRMFIINIVDQYCKHVYFDF
uniref:Methyltransferase FkbM domain-containing protein n=1 Tax=Panagrolaimus sp. JU765 TaxID=591449 RepID=A0AC34RQ72_9BILA